MSKCALGSSARSDHLLWANNRIKVFSWDSVSDRLFAQRRAIFVRGLGDSEKRQLMKLLEKATAAGNGLSRAPLLLKKAS